MAEEINKQTQAATKNEDFEKIQEWLNSDSNTTWDEWQTLKNGSRVTNCLTDNTL